MKEFSQKTPSQASNNPTGTKKNNEKTIPYSSSNKAPVPKKNKKRKSKTEKRRKGIIIASENILVFDTAWSYPETIIQKLSELFDVSVKLVYADEDYGSCNCGYVEYGKGMLQEDRNPIDYEEAAKFTENVWSYDDYVEEFKPEHHPQLTMLC